MGQHDPSLIDEATAFADDVADLLNSTVADDASIKAHVLEDRVVVAALDEDGGTIFIPLSINTARVARLRIEYECIWDREGKYLAIKKSRFAVLSSVIAEPILRFEYLGDEETPGRAAHVHAHGECTQLGALYAAAGVENKANLQRLHLPVGGKRFRPCVEDIIEFLITDLSVDGKPGWEDRVEIGRQRWYGYQLGAAMRKYEDVAVQIMGRLGYAVHQDR